VMVKEFKPHLHARLVLMTFAVFAVSLLVNVNGIQAGEEDPSVGDGDEPAILNTAGVDTLLVTLEGLKAGKGNIRVAVFEEGHREEFPEGRHLYGAVVPAAKEKVTVAIANIPPGQYAVAVFQDLNENEKLDRNIFTKPKEPYGFSGAWKGGKASFEEALIDTEKVGFAISIKLK
jgi:uncharacterized protein (DUF2141 family)